MKFCSIKGLKFYGLIAGKVAVFFYCFFFSAFSMAQESIWDGAEITCDNVLKAFTEYNDTISFEQQAFIDSLGGMRKFLAKSPQEIINSRSEAEQRISDAINQRIDQKLTIENIGDEIEDILEECIQK